MTTIQTFFFISTQVRNILDRKNTEISDVKLFYQKKMGDLDELVKSRDTVIATLTEKLNTMEQKYVEEVRIVLVG